MGTAKRSKLEIASWLAGIFSAVLAVVALLVAVAPGKDVSTAQQPAPPVTVTTGSYSPIVSGAASVTFNQGPPDWFLREWAASLRRQGAQDKEIDGLLDAVRQNNVSLRQVLEQRAARDSMAATLVPLVTAGNYSQAVEVLRVSSIASPSQAHSQSQPVPLAPPASELRPMTPSNTGATSPAPAITLVASPDSDCVRRSSVETTCSYIAKVDGTHVIQATAYATRGRTNADVWVEMHVNGNSCGNRTGVRFDGANGSSSSQCSVRLVRGQTITIVAKAGNFRADAAGVVASVQAPE